MTRIVVERIGDLRERAGEELFVSEWHEISQARIDKFAEATGDTQWIHVDTERARMESPYGTTIAHGYLTLSLIAGFFQDTLSVKNRRRGLNYGLNRVRFLSPVPAGSRVRGRHRLLKYEDVEGGAQLTWQVTVELEGSEKPACAIEAINRMYE